MGSHPLSPKLRIFLRFKPKFQETCLNSCRSRNTLIQDTKFSLIWCPVVQPWHLPKPPLKSLTNSWMSCRKLLSILHSVRLVVTLSCSVPIFVAVDQWNSLQGEGLLLRLGEEAPRKVESTYNPIVRRLFSFEGLKMV